MNMFSSEAANDAWRDLAELICGERTGHVKAVKLLKEHWSGEFMGDEHSDGGKLWEHVGQKYIRGGRYHEAIYVFRAMYEEMLRYQQKAQIRVHKGMPLCWTADCYGALKMRALAKRHLMLTLCEDTVTSKGQINPNVTGTYWRIVWLYGLSDAEFRRYEQEIWQTYCTSGEEGWFSEHLLLTLDTDWMTELPTANESRVYVTSSEYLRHLLGHLGRSKGRSLEQIALYLLSCIPGCHARSRVESSSTDYDVVAVLEGQGLDFRSEVGRYVLCECKDWQRSADFTTFAKFTQVLRDVGSRFGILFAKNGISGSDGKRYASREQLKVFQHDQIVIVVIEKNDLERLAKGANLVQILTRKYEEVRLDVPGH